MNLQDTMNALAAIGGMAFLAAWACGLLLVDAFTPRGRKGITAVLAAVGLGGALAITLLQAGAPARTAFNGMAAADGYATYLNVLFLVSGLAGILLAYDYLKRMEIERGEYYALLLFSTAGMMLMAQAADLIMVFLALELLSFPLYVMAAFANPQPQSQEAGLKYFLLGSFSTGILVYGIALIYGATGTTGLSEIVARAGAETTNPTLLLIGAGLVLIGLGFKVGAVPFHMWSPDVYQGSPTAVTGFMAVGAKAGGFAALLRVFVLAFPGLAGALTPALWGMAALTMVVGNLLAVAQGNMKRMLAYSSIAHAGYILMALAPYGQEGIAQQGAAAALFYLAAYALTSFAAWAVVIALEQAEGKGLLLQDYAGLGRKYPLLALAMAVAMFSFTGVPPTLGFVGKFYLFSVVLKGGFTWLAIIGVLTSLISAYYYLRVVIVMYMQDGEPVVRRERWIIFTALSTAALTVLLTLFAGPLLQWAAQAVMQLL